MLARIAPISPVKCPCCGHAVDRPDFATFLLTLNLGPNEFRMVCRLARCFGRWLAKEVLIDFIWADDIDGGPEYARQAVSVMRIKINEKLIASDFVIEGRRWQGWRLTWRARVAA